MATKQFPNTKYLATDGPMAGKYLTLSHGIRATHWFQMGSFPLGRYETKEANTNAEGKQNVSTNLDLYWVNWGE